MANQKPAEVRRAVGRRVAELRRQLDLTQAGLAARMGDDAEAAISPQYIGLIEQGRENLTIEQLVRVANALNVAPRALFDAPAAGFQPGPGRPRKPR